MPKAFAEPLSGDSELAPGSVVIFQALAGERLDHLLCAHVEDTRWLCHPGSFLEGQLDFDNPFDAADLVEMDILRDAWSEDGKPAHYISRQIPLLDAVLNHEDAWSGLVAIATFKAEELRAGTERPLNMALAKASFECNPFLWGNSMLTRQLYALWSCTVNGAICRNIVQQRLDHALDRWILSPSWSFSPSPSTTFRPLSCHGLWLAVTMMPAPAFGVSAAAHDTAAVGRMPRSSTVDPPATSPSITAAAR